MSLGLFEVRADVPPWIDDGRRSCLLVTVRWSDGDTVLAGQRAVLLWCV
jgi:hypothetical protein